MNELMTARLFAHVIGGHLPGNARELQRELTERLTRAELTNAAADLSAADAFPAPADQPAKSATAETLPTEAVEAALEAADYVILRAARRLGVTSQSLHERMARLGLRRAVDLTDADIDRALEENGSLDAAARALRVSPRALQLRRRGKG